MNQAARFLAVIAFFLPVTPVLRAASINWTNAGTGNWAASNNWAPAMVPGGADEAGVDNGGTAQVTNAQVANVSAIGIGPSTAGTLRTKAGFTMNRANHEHPGRPLEGMGDGKCFSLCPGLSHLVFFPGR